MQEISAILSELLPLIKDPRFCAPSSINLIFFGNNFFNLFKSQLLPNKEVEITALVFLVINLLTLLILRLKFSIFASTKIGFNFNNKITSITESQEKLGIIISSPFLN